jgi:hypothetical protein
MAGAADIYSRFRFFRFRCFLSIISFHFFAHDEAFRRLAASPSAFAATFHFH